MIYIEFSCKVGDFERFSFFNYICLKWRKVRDICAAFHEEDFGERGVFRITWGNNSKHLLDVDLGIIPKLKS